MDMLTMYTFYYELCLDTVLVLKTTSSGSFHEMLFATEHNIRLLFAGVFTSDRGIPQKGVR